MNPFLTPHSIGSVQAPIARTIAFTALVVGEFAVIHLIRSDYKTKFLSNKWLLLAVGGSFLLHLGVLYTPLNHFFEAVPLSLEHWTFILVGVAIMMALGMLVYKVLRWIIPSEGVKHRGTKA